MKWSETELRELLQNLHETLAVEVKRWVDPQSPHGMAAIARACIALRNHDGGCLVIGFDDDTLRAMDAERPPCHREVYHQDIIQAIVRRHAAQSFEVEVVFVDRDDSEFPIIVVPSGVKTPVAARCDLYDSSSGRKLVTEHTVYVRSLDANNTASTTSAKWQDWPALVERCMDNREADIGRFLRRYLGPSGFAGLAALSLVHPPESKSLAEASHCRPLLQRGRERFEKENAERQFQPPDIGFWEVSLAILGETPTKHTASQSFLNLISSSNPGLTGWPIWLDSSGFREKKSRPYVFDNAWEAHIVSLDESWSDHLDFWRIEPSGCFYLLRAIDDDIARSPNAPGPKKQLDFAIWIWRVAETLAVARRFAEAMSFDTESTQLAFLFRWSELRNRTLSSWSTTRRMLNSRTARQNEIEASVTVPLSSADSTLHEYVEMVTRKLFSIFDGYELSSKIHQDIVSELLDRGKT